MADKLRSREVAALRRALDTERFAAKSANDKCAELQKALDNERSAVRALRRELLAQVKAAREEETKKYTLIMDELKDRMALGQSEAIEAQKEEISRALIVDFQRTMRARQEEWRRDTKKQIGALKEQVKEAQRIRATTEPDKTDKDALIRSVQAEFQKMLHIKQEEWKRETATVTNALNSQLKDTQRLYDEARTRLAAVSNDNDHTHKLRQEIQTLKERNRPLEDRIQVLMESERRKADDFRSQHDNYERRLLELQKAAKKETHQILEEMKSKDRIILNLEKELHQVMKRLDTQQSEVTRSRVNLDSSCRCRTDSEKTEESPRTGAVKRLKTANYETPSLINEEPKLSEKTENKTDNEGSREVEKVDESELRLEMQYKTLYEEHQELKRSYIDLLNRLQETPQSVPFLEEQFELHCVNTGMADDMVMAEKVCSLQQRVTELEMETRELREHNDLLEFRLMELDDGIGSNCSSNLHFNKSPLSRSPDTREVIDSDDISDSGVMSLSASEDISESDLQDIKLEPSQRDIKSRLMQMCQTVESVADRMSLQQTLSLLRHYESKIESLESTLAAMCHEPAMGRQRDVSTKKTKLLDDTTKSPCRIIATVLPFTDLPHNYSKQLKEDFSLKKFLREADGLQESGIFDESGDNSDVICTQSTQTEWSFDDLDSSPGDLGTEIRKLTQIRERIEEQNGNKKLLRSPSDELLIQDPLKEILFYKERLEILENKVAVYESNGNEQTKMLSSRLEREVLLRAEVKHLKATVEKLQEENRRLEEDKCEFEEAENDTRLRCQKLEVKLSALGEKKSDLQVQLQQNARTMANLRSSLAEEERKRTDARQHAARLESLVNQYEQRNFELEEKILEVSFNLQTLENVLTALIVWHLWHILNALKPCVLNALVIQHSGLGKELTLCALCTETCKNKISEDCSCELERTSTSEHSYRNSSDLIKCKCVKKTISDSICKQNIHLNETSDQIISDLRHKCYRLENRLKELEERERKYNIALQKTDEVWETMENKLKLQLQETEEELLKKQIELDKKETQIKKLAGNNEIELHLNERLLHLEEEVYELHDLLNQKEKEKKTLLETQQRMFQELETYIEKLHNFKTHVEIPLREELELQSKKYKEIQKELEIQEKEKSADDELYVTEINRLKQCLRKSNKDLEENEVTISELKEEVQTLEMALTELRNTLNQEREKNERLKIEVGAELEAKDFEIKMLRERSVVNQTLDIEMAECLRNCEGGRNYLHIANKKRNRSKHAMRTSKRRPEAGFQVELDSTVADAASTIPCTQETITNQIPKITQQKSEISVTVPTKSTNLPQRIIFM